MKWRNRKKYEISGTGIVQLFLSFKEESKLLVGIETSIHVIDTNPCD
jgi:hypothetical protein